MTVEDIKIDWDDAEPVGYGVDQTNVPYPHSFAIVSFSLEATEALKEIADGIRDDDGFGIPIDEAGGCYEFGVGIWENNGTLCVENCIEFTPVGIDDEGVYCIWLTDEDKATVMEALKEECRKHGTTVEELMKESERRLDDDFNRIFR